MPDVIRPGKARRWSRISLMTVIACREAIADAGLHEAEATHRVGLVLGTEFGDLRSTETFNLGFLRKGPLGLSPLLFPNTVMNAPAGPLMTAHLGHQDTGTTYPNAPPVARSSRTTAMLESPSRKPTP